MAVKTQTPLDAARVKLDFPILGKPVHGKPLVYLDSADSSQKPRAAIDRSSTSTRSYANVHRGVYALGEVATERYEGARDTVAAFLNAPLPARGVFTRQATEGAEPGRLRLRPQPRRPRRRIVTTEMEHHSNLVPWW